MVTHESEGKFYVQIEGNLLDPVLLKQRVLGPKPLFRGRFRRSRGCIGYAGLNSRPERQRVQLA